jgi:hypothetical protein
MRLIGFKRKYRAADAPAPTPAPEIVPHLLSPEDTALLNHDAMYLRALTRERRAIDQR